MAARYWQLEALKYYLPYFEMAVVWVEHYFSDQLLRNTQFLGLPFFTVVAAEKISVRFSSLALSTSFYWRRALILISIFNVENYGKLFFGNNGNVVYLVISVPHLSRMPMPGC